MSHATDLLDLSNNLRRLLSTGNITQKEIQRELKIDQATISRVLNGKRKRVTDQIKRLIEYVNMRIGPVEISRQVEEAARDFLKQGGTEVELVASIEHSARLVSRKMR